MAPVAVAVAQDATGETTTPAKAYVPAPTSILYRVPERPPITRSAHGPYMLLEDGRTMIDAVGGAAVTCIGNGHPKVVQAIKDQADKLSCGYIFWNKCLKLS